MRPALLEYLACPHCLGTLRCETIRAEGPEVMDGTLSCAGCGATFPVRGGVPRMLSRELTSPEGATARAFGTEWKILSQLSEVFQAEFRSYLEPMSPSELKDLVVLDAGCGMGKFTLAAANAGARAVIGVDLSEAVDVAYGHLRHLPNAHVVQASIYQLPFRPGTFDFIFSIGVLHHLPDPEKGFLQLPALARPSARILIWVYALEGNEAFVRWVDPLRTLIFSRLPSWSNRVVATVLSLPLWVLIHSLYVPLNRRGLAHHLPYADYFLYFSRLGFRTFWGTVYDKLVPPISFYLTRDSLRGWLATADLSELWFRHRNGNSWTCLSQRGRRA
jgi:SAM-dependent methyltransferase